MGLIRKLYSKLNMNIVYPVLLLVLAVGFVYTYIITDKEEQERISLEEDHYAYINDYYEVLARHDRPVLDKHAVLYDVYLTYPFVTNFDIEYIVNTLVKEEQEFLANSTEEIYHKAQLHALEVNFYHRMSNYEEYLAPLGVAYFQHKDGWEASFTNRLRNYRNHEVDIDFLYLQRVPYDESSELDLYFESGEDKYWYIPDEEYEHLKEIILFSRIAGSSDTLRGIDIYIGYHYGLTRDPRHIYDFLDIYDKLEDLVEAGRRYGEPTNIYGDNLQYIIEYYREKHPEIYNFVEEWSQ